jgi:cytochrome P450
MTSAIEHLAPPKDASPLAAPFIAEAVGDLRRPTGDVPLCNELDELPGAGGLWAGIRNVVGWQRLGNEHLLDQVRRYGPVYRADMASIPVVCVADAEMVGSIMRNDERVWSSPLAYKALFGGIDPTSATIDSPVGFDFETHRDVRRFLQPAFSADALVGYVGTASAAYAQALAPWVAQGRVSFRSAVRALFANVASRIFMGIDDPAETTRLDRAMAEIWLAPFALVKHPLLSPTWRRGMRGYRTIRETFRARVDDRRANGTGTDLFTRMCKTGREDLAWLDDDTLVRLFIGIMVAAFDTTSLAATSMAYLLAKHPEWQERLRAEGRSVAPGPLSYDDTKRLEEHDWAWKETLRLYPVAQAVPRRALRDVQLGAYRVPAGTQVQAMIACVLRDPAWWTRPETFDPARFSPARAEDKKHKSAFAPFGAGPHVCIGMQLAGLEVKAFWHALLSKCRIRLAEDYTARHQALPLGAVSGPVNLVLDPL